MINCRNGVPLLGILALVSLFLNLLGIPIGCKTCSWQNPYFTLLGTGYFAGLIATSLLFPSFPNRRIAQAGLTWAIVLASSLIYLNGSNLCAACLVAHACHIVIWVIWLCTSSTVQISSALSLRERTYLLLVAPISAIALFSCLNLTFKVYGFQRAESLPISHLKSGDAIPSFSIQTSKGELFNHADIEQTTAVILNFISPQCPHCAEQLPLVNTVVNELGDKSYRFINISPILSPELLQSSPIGDWAEDKEGKLQELFKVDRFPTLFILGNEGKIVQVILGVPSQLQTSLLTNLAQLRSY